MSKVCDLCSWEIPAPEDQYLCRGCKKTVCKSCFKSGGFSEQDRYDIMKQIDAPKEIGEDLQKLLDADVDPRAELCKDCLTDRFLTQYVGVLRYGTISD